MTVRRPKTGLEHARKVLGVRAAIAAIDDRQSKLRREKAVKKAELAELRKGNK